MGEERQQHQGEGVFSIIWGETKALLLLLSDFSFKKFVTPRLVRTLYALSLVAAALSAVGWMFGGLGDGMISRLVRFVTGPLAFLLYLVVARVGMEFLLAVFKIAENVEQLNGKTRAQNESPQPPRIGG